jgi:serine/threonine protein kinase
MLTTDCILDLLGEWEQRFDQGEDVPPDQLAPNTPEIWDYLRQRIDNRKKMLHLLDTQGLPTTHQTPSPRPEIPQYFCGYQVVGLLGQGGMGIVNKARQLSLNRIVALKMLPAGKFAGPESQARFRVEAEAVAQLQHQNIVEIYEIGDHAGWPFFSMEYCSGGNLAEKLQKNPIPPREAADIVQVLAQAVHYAHKKNIIHRDLKPLNILLVPNEDNSPPEEMGKSGPRFTTLWRLKISDFGLAKKLDAERALTDSWAGGAGTVEYMAPEQAAGRTDKISFATDIYALGVILYELLTGRPPFKGANKQETIQQIFEKQPVPPIHQQPNCPRDLNTICLKCLEKDPAKRYGTALELAQDLQRFLQGKPIRARPIGHVEYALRWCQRYPALTGLALTLIATLGLTAWIIFQGMQLHQKNDQIEHVKMKKKEADAEKEKAIREKKLADEEKVQAIQELEAVRREEKSTRSATTVNSQSQNPTEFPTRPREDDLLRPNKDGAPLADSSREKYQRILATVSVGEPDRAEKEFRRFVQSETQAGRNPAEIQKIEAHFTEYKRQIQALARLPLTELKPAPNLSPRPAPGKNETPSSQDQPPPSSMPPDDPKSSSRPSADMEKRPSVQPSVPDNKPSALPPMSSRSSGSPCARCLTALFPPSSKT